MPNYIRIKTRDGWLIEQVGESSVSSTNAGWGSVKLVLEIRGLHFFYPKGEPNSLSVRWKRWKRAFNLYVASKGVTNEKQKVALLLHSGGMELQEVFYTLVPEDRETPFKDCLAALDNYFTRKANVPFNVQQLDSESNHRSVCLPSASESYIVWNSR